MTPLEIGTSGNFLGFLCDGCHQIGMAPQRGRRVVKRSTSATLVNTSRMRINTYPEILVALACGEVLIELT